MTRGASLPWLWRLRAAATAAVLPPLISIVSLERLARWARLPARRPAGTDTLDDVALDAWVRRMLVRLPGPWRLTCLRRCAVLYHLLRRAGRPVELVIGVRRDDRTFAAHAWLLRDGEPYLEADPGHATRFSVIARFPESSAAAGGG